jgi:hypothetical protein
MIKELALRYSLSSNISPYHILRVTNNSHKPYFASLSTKPKELSTILESKYP